MFVHVLWFFNTQTQEMGICFYNFWALKQLCLFLCIFSVFFCGVCFHFKCTKWSQNILNIFAIHPPIHTCYLEFEISQISVACEKVNARFGYCTDWSQLNIIEVGLSYLSVNIIWISSYKNMQSLEFSKNHLQEIFLHLDWEIRRKTISVAQYQYCV